MNILVTGATGFIGSHLCKELVKQGYHIFGLSLTGRTNRIKSLLQEGEFHLEIGDIRHEQFVNAIIKKNHIDVIFHLAAHLPNSEENKNSTIFIDTNIKGTLNLLRAAYFNKVEKFLYASSMSVYSEPPEYLPVDENHPVWPHTIYGISKLSGEFCCNMYSKAMNLVVLRYSGAYGLYERRSNAMYKFINQALSNRAITIFGDGSQTTDFVYIDDVVQASLLALNGNQPGIYNIGSGEEVSILDLSKRIIYITSSKSEIIFTGRDTDRPFRFYLDITKSKNTFGYSPCLLEEGLHKYLKEFKVEV